jgi:hypothetical protein
MLACYQEIEGRLEKNQQNKCPGPLLCQPPKEIKQDCVVLRNSYESAYIGAGLIVYKASNSELITSDSCFIPEVND